MKTRIHQIFYSLLFIIIICSFQLEKSYAKDITTYTRNQSVTEKPESHISRTSLSPSTPTAPTPTTSASAPTLQQIQMGKKLLEKEDTESPEQNGQKQRSDTVPESDRENENTQFLDTQLSPFESFVLGMSTIDVSMDIRQFGYDLFEQPPSTFAPVDIIPVGPDYLLGPGDELKISLWGKVNADYSAVIDVEGKISLPQVGVLSISGLTFKEAKEFIKKEFTRYYKPGEVKINISTGKLRTIRVFVVGKAKNPGSYTLSSLSTLINALFAAGGPGKSGTMRDIQVRRDGSPAVHFDMYDFLLKGDKSNDIRLLSGDVIFIPPVGPLVAIAGNVNTPAIYELKGKTSLQNLIDMAGGLMATAYPYKIQVERIFENQARKLIDLNLEEMSNSNDFILQEGDIVKVYSINDTIINPIEVRGNIVRPGKYEWRKGLRIKDILNSVDALLPDTFMDFAMVERLVPPDYHKEYISFSPGRLLIQGDEHENIELQPYDTIVIFNKWDLMEKEYVRITGAINKPGKYEFHPNMKLSDLLKLAGGFKRYASLEEAELTRIILDKEGPKTEKILVNPVKALTGEADFDIPLKPDDYVFIRTIPEWSTYRKVSIEGEVRYPGVYTIEKGETLSSLIRRAGGFTDKAYLKGAVFTRESVRKLQQRQIEEAIDRLEQQILSRSAKGVETALTPERAEQQRVVVEQRKALIAKLRAAKAKGRISIKLDTLDKFTGSPSDIILEEGDRLMIPQKPQQIQVIGAVYNQTAFVYEPRRAVNSYIKMAGGLTEDANEDSIFILKVDGTAISKKNIRNMMNNRMILDPGDTIVVPEKIEKVAWLREITDITQILYQIAVTAGVLIVTF